MARIFHIGDILTVTTDFIVSPRGMKGATDVLNYMTNDALFHHQLSRAVEECKPELLRQHPQLNSVVVPEDFDEWESWEKWLVKSKEWLEKIVAKFGERLPVKPLPSNAHIYKNPIEELCDIVGPEKVVVFNGDNMDEVVDILIKKKLIKSP